MNAKLIAEDLRNVLLIFAYGNYDQEKRAEKRIDRYHRQLIFLDREDLFHDAVLDLYHQINHKSKRV